MHVLMLQHWAKLILEQLLSATVQEPNAASQNSANSLQRRARKTALPEPRAGLRACGNAAVKLAMC